MSLIDKDKAVDAIAMYLFVNDAIKTTEPMKVADYKVFAKSILKDVAEVDAIPRDYYDKVTEELCRKHTEEIASMPSVVRCKECRYYLQGECIALHTMTKADDFCSYGDRRK